MTNLSVRSLDGSTSPAGIVPPRSRAAWGNDDVPIVLRLPDVHAQPAHGSPPAPSSAAAHNSPPAPNSPPAEVMLPASTLLAAEERVAQPLPLWLFVIVAAVGVILGLVALDRWKAYRAANQPKSSRDVYQPVPTWKEPLSANPAGTASQDDTARERDAVPQRNAAEPGAAMQATAAGQGEIQQTAAVSPLAPDPPAPRNRHFGPPAFAGGSDAARAAGSPAGNHPTTGAGPASAGTAQPSGEIATPQPRPTYDSARPSLH